MTFYDYTAGLHPVPLPFTHPLAASGERNLCGWHSLPNAGYGTPHVATGVNQRGQAMLVGPTGWEAQSAAWMDGHFSSRTSCSAAETGWGVHRNSIEPSDCCDQRYGPKGRPDCWDEYFTYELCCVGVQSLDSREVVTGWPPWPQKIWRIELISISLTGNLKVFETPGPLSDVPPTKPPVDDWGTAVVNYFVLGRVRTWTWPRCRTTSWRRPSTSTWATRCDSWEPSTWDNPMPCRRSAVAAMWSLM